jgi:hypothetical protein
MLGLIAALATSDVLIQKIIGACTRRIHSPPILRQVLESTVDNPAESNRLASETARSQQTCGRGPNTPRGKQEEPASCRAVRENIAEQGCRRGA